MIVANGTPERESGAAGGSGSVSRWLSRESMGMDSPPHPRIAVVLTCHNRRETTLECLKWVNRQFALDSLFAMLVFLVDDGSSDGTGDAVRELYPSATVIDGSGNLFWARGMNLALAAAAQVDPDFFFWLNDDVVLDSDAVLRALAAYKTVEPGSIVVGATRWHSKDGYSYSGSKLGNRRRPTSLGPVAPAPEETIAVDAFNGNIVLVPKSAFEQLGNIDAGFRHAYGDIDYGLRAGKYNIRSYLMPGYAGRCDGNAVDGTWRDVRLARRSRLRLLIGRKGVPVRSHWRFVSRHGGILAPLWFAATYAKAFIFILLARSEEWTTTMSTTTPMESNS